MVDTKEKSKIWETLVKDFLRDNPGKAACVHWDLCNGCRVMPLAYEKQLVLKSQILGQELGPFLTGQTIPVEPSLSQTYFRNKIDLSCLDGVIGYRRRDDFAKTFEVKDCLLVSKEANEIVGAAAELLKQRGMTFHDPVKHEGFLRYIVYRESKTTGEKMLNFVTYNMDEEFQLQETVRALREKWDVQSINWLLQDSLSDHSRGQVLRTWGEPTIRERILGCTFLIEPNTFFQVNPLLAEKMFAEAIAGIKPEDRVVDLFCGVGAISLPAAKKAKVVYGIELDEDAARLARKNAELNEVKNAVFMAGDVRKRIKNLTHTFEYAIIDPPRSGLGARLIERVKGLAPREIAYVSCNPISLAEDLELFQPEYKVKSVKGYDLFPNTPHVESLTILERVK